MHGIIHVELKKYVETKHDRDTWKAILKQAGLENTIYMPTMSYPDEETVKIVTAACELTGSGADTILEDFGEFIVPALISLYGTLIKPEWDVVEMLLNTEQTIHTEVRRKNPGAQPPKLRFERVGPNELKFLYNSPRQMAAVAKGIIQGVAKH